MAVNREGLRPHPIIIMAIGNTDISYKIKNFHKLDLTKNIIMINHNKVINIFLVLLIIKNIKIIQIILTKKINE